MFHIIMCCILACNIWISICSATPQNWKVDLDDGKTSAFYYYWNKCVGSGHSALMLREDWRTWMKHGADAIGFKYVRAHGILDDDIGAVNGINDYSFINIDKIYSYLLSIGMKPFIEISFMPNLFGSTNATRCHYKGNISPPKDYNIWYDFIKQWAQHLVDTFGADEVSTWPFEVWNEPNDNFWAGTPKYESYLQLYNATARAIKSANTRLQVGGPTINHPDIDWINRFLNDTLSMNIPIDFVVFHSYPNKQQPLSEYMEAIQNAIHLVEDYNSKYKVELPSMISEYASTCCYPFDGYDDEYAASFLIYSAMYLQPLFPQQKESAFKWMSYWAISDVFEEQGFKSSEFKGLYGMQTIRGIAKPAFRAMELLQRFGGNVSYPTRLMTQSEAHNNTVLAYSLRNNKGGSSIFVSNFNSKQLEIEAQDVNIYVNMNSNVKVNAVVMYRIDSEHTNPLQIWNDMESPTYPTDSQLQKINDTSQLIPVHNVNYTVLNQTTTKISFNIPVYGVVVLDLLY